MNNIVGLKIPLFLLYITSLAIGCKPDYKYIPILGIIIIIQLVSLSFGLLDNQTFEYSITLQFFIYFLLYICLLWRKKVDILKPLVFSSIIVSIITIVSFVALTSFPELFDVIYAWSRSYDNVIILSKRKFLDMDFNQVFYKSIPLVIIPAAYYTNKLVYYTSNRCKNFIIVTLFLFALFCSGSRSLLGALFLIVFCISYRKIAKMKVLVPLMIIIFILASYVFYIAITDTNESSAELKGGFISAYVNYFTEKFYLLLFGSGAGSCFETNDRGMTFITELTYLELVRIYGIIGFVLILHFFVTPLYNYNKKKKYINNWKPLSYGFIIYLLISGSNPYLISSSGFMCILLMYSVVSNPKYQIKRE